MKGSLILIREPFKLYAVMRLSLQCPSEEDARLLVKHLQTVAGAFDDEYAVLVIDLYADGPLEGLLALL